jgi:hypothetical protein
MIGVLNAAAGMATRGELHWARAVADEQGRRPSPVSAVWLTHQQAGAEAASMRAVLDDWRSCCGARRPATLPSSLPDLLLLLNGRLLHPLLLNASQ